ncbi:MAG: Gmad2 immunoglobulin-like domain-containing protein [Bacillota bacterium]
MKVTLKKMFFLLLSVLMLVACTQEQEPQKPSQEEQTQIEKETDKDALSEEKFEEEEVRSNNEKNVAVENEAFRIFEPLPTSEVSTGFSVIGEARVFEGTVQYELQDIQGNVISEGFTTATDSGPEWGDFEISVKYDIDKQTEGTLFIFEESAEDGSRLHEIQIPLQLSQE